MFISVKDLCYLMDERIKYVEEAIEAEKIQATDDYEEYMEKMKSKLLHNVQKLESISSNQKLINKYRTKVQNLFQ